jgi:hypothetical protein
VLCIIFYVVSDHRAQREIGVFCNFASYLFNTVRISRGIATTAVADPQQDGNNPRLATGKPNPNQQFAAYNPKVRQPYVSG